MDEKRQQCRKIIEQLKINVMRNKPSTERDYAAVITYFGLQLCPTGGMQAVPELEMDKFMMNWIYEHYPDIRKVLERREKIKNCAHLRVVK